MTKTRNLLFGAATVLAVSAAHAAETAPPAPPGSGAALANNCFTCHGPHGRSPGEMPSLDKLSAADLVTAIKQFRSGERPSTVMGRLAKGYSDADIDAIAAFIASAGGAR